MSRRTLPRRLLMAAVGSLVIAGLVACADDTGPRRGVPATLPPNRPSSHTPSGGPSPAGPTSTGPLTATPTPAPGSGGGIRAMLLTEDQVPGLDAEAGWTQRDTVSGEGTELPSVCQQAPWLSIGATRVVRRDFAGPGDASATNVVAGFADTQSAARAVQVWNAWETGCRTYATAQGRAPVQATGTQRQLDTAAGPAGWWLVAYGPSDTDNARHVETGGLVQWRRHISFVVLSQVTGNYGEQPGQAPIAGALRAAGADLKR